MAILTTCVGAYPKPHDAALPDWFNIPAGPQTANRTRQWPLAWQALGPDAEKIITRGVEQAVRDQVLAGIDIPSACTDRPVKIAMPGPLAIADTNADRHCHDDRKPGSDLAEALNQEVLALAEGGVFRRHGVLGDLGLLDGTLALSKLGNMSTAARAV